MNTLTVPLESSQALAAWLPLIEAMPDAVWLVDGASLSIAAANRHAVALFGGAEARELVGRDMLELAATPEDLAFWGEVAEGLTERIESETLMRRFDGRAVPVLRQVSRVESEGAALFVVVVHDRSAQVRLERELEDSLAELQATLESSADGILVTDLAGRIRHCNRRFAELWSVPPEILARRDDDALLEWMRRSVVDPGAYMRRLAQIDEATMLQAADRIELHADRVFERVTMPQCSRGRPIGRVFSFRDLTDRIRAMERIEFLSQADALTGLPNRRLLAERIERSQAQARRDGTPFALLLLNLDRFKHVNETFGHAFADHVLAEVAARIKKCTREVDTLSRLGGDEFALLVHGADTAGAEVSARRIAEALQVPFAHDGLRFTVTVSVGIALHAKDGVGMDAMLHSADAAMREVKRSGRSGYRFHRERAGGDEAGARNRMQIDHAMRQALTHGRFRLNYQPQVDMADGGVRGVEALLRWRDPVLGEMPPGEFIPVAEESGFIVPIGDWVLRQAVQQAALWRAAGHPMAVAVNVSALQFRQPSFVEGVAAVLREARLPPALLELELTESILIQDIDETLVRLQALAHLGVLLSIDDFGTGYSSLAYLKRLPITRLKIDRSFVSALPEDESDAAIVRAIVNMGRALHLHTIAEGVETEAQRAFLEAAGCDQLQGWLVAPALAVPAFEDWIGWNATSPTGLQDH